MVDRLVNSEANSRRITFVEQCFGTSGQPLRVPGRVLVGEGVLTKMCRKKPKPRQFFLFNDILVYGNIVINKKKYNKQHVIGLEDVKLVSVNDEGTLRNGWKIFSPSKSFVVYAATATEKLEWMAHIKKCVQDLLNKQGKTQSSTVDSPVWVPDHEASKCMHCRKTQFSVINRRHHCRRCGMLVCNPCSNKRWLLPQQSSKPLRVCLTCYDKVSRAHTGPQRASEYETAANEDSSGDDSSDDEDEVGPAGEPASIGDDAPQIGTFYGEEENNAA
ncbi:pleckstrin homology domain-containing family F member 2-like [Liolophura sinensis]|uniref:pleckstrin homology domain-containing family F member 2-like n=1 Tax=Liolophura sinensis TaxID=3198878 RepID=UPI00315959DB